MSSPSTSAAVKILSKTVVTKKGGLLWRCQHASTSTNTDMIFAIFLPHQYATMKEIPSLYFLSGLTCTDQNFSQKAGPAAFPAAEAAGLALVMPDTSPRGDNVANDANYDLGQGAGFYINATQEPWAAHFQMETYVSEELPAVIASQWPQVSSTNKSVTGHSMGGHGALTLYFKSCMAEQQKKWTSVSALAPICHPTACPWGKKAFENYLGSVEEAGAKHDATELLLQANKSLADDILIDQGTADEFLQEQLRLPDIQDAAEKVGQKLNVRTWDGMDHSYYFISACIADHVEFHAGQLNSSN